MGWGKKIRKAVSKVVKNVTRASTALATGGLSEANGFGKKMGEAAGGLTDVVTGQASADAKKAKAAAAAQAQAEQEAADKAAADRYKASILGQRQQNIADALGSQTDFTGDEERDPRELVNRPEVSKKKKLIGF